MFLLFIFACHVKLKLPSHSKTEKIGLSNAKRVVGEVSDFKVPLKQLSLTFNYKSFSQWVLDRRMTSYSSVYPSMLNMRAMQHGKHT